MTKIKIRKTTIENKSYNNQMFKYQASSIVVRFVKPDVVCCVYHIVCCINVVTLQHLLEKFRLMNLAFLHEVNDLILVGQGLVNIVVKLDLYLILELTFFAKEIFLIRVLSEIFAILSKKIKLIGIGP